MAASMNLPIGQSALVECGDCQRQLPASETLTNGKCRICARVDWRAKGIEQTPASVRTPCPRCKGKRRWKFIYCKPCAAWYTQQYRARKRAEKAIEKKFSGVDIDAIHSNPRFKAVK